MHAKAEFFRGFLSWDCAESNERNGALWNGLWAKISAVKHFFAFLRFF
jgi:hypothetical protein